MLKKELRERTREKVVDIEQLLFSKKRTEFFFAYAFGKNQRDNINDPEEKTLKKLAQYLLDATKTNLETMIINGDLFEVIDEENKR